MQTLQYEWTSEEVVLKSQETRERTMIVPLGGTKGAVWVRSVPYRVKKTQTPVATRSAIT